MRREEEEQIREEENKEGQKWEREKRQSGCSITVKGMGRCN